MKQENNDYLLLKCGTLLIVLIALLLIFMGCDSTPRTAEEARIISKENKIKAIHQQINIAIKLGHSKVLYCDGLDQDDVKYLTDKGYTLRWIHSCCWIQTAEIITK